MATVSQLLAALEAEVGTTENPPGSNCQKYSHELGRPCEKWCDDFLDWIAKGIGLHLPVDSASTRVTAKAFQDAGLWGQEPKIGAWVFWDFKDESKGIQHVEVVIDFDVNFLYDIGGNTSFDSGGSQSNGGAVAKRKRKRDSQIVGFGYPKFDSEEDMTQDQANQLTDTTKRVANLEKVSHDFIEPTLKDVQSKVNALSVGGIDYDKLSNMVADKLASRLKD